MISWSGKDYSSFAFSMECLNAPVDPDRQRITGLSLVMSLLSSASMIKRAGSSCVDREKKLLKLNLVSAIFQF